MQQGAGNYTSVQERVGSENKVSSGSYYQLFPTEKLIFSLFDILSGDIQVGGGRGVSVTAGN